jgi:hypothetical protein
MIPKIIWQTHEWDYEDLPDNFKKSSMTWRNLNSAWEYKYLNSAKRAKEVESFSTELYKFYPFLDKLTQADIWRYITLYKYGGFYADMDSVCSSPLDFVISNIPEGIELVVTPRNEDGHINNANFGALVKNNTCLKDFIDQILNKYLSLTLVNVVEKARDKDSILQAIEEKLWVGPELYSSTMQSYPDLVCFKHYGAIHGSEIKDPNWTPTHVVNYYGKHILYVDLAEKNNWSLG